jgi:negative regulator of genetic competence, sporulation and motility
MLGRPKMRRSEQHRKKQDYFNYIYSFFRIIDIINDEIKRFDVDTRVLKLYAQRNV